MKVSFSLKKFGFAKTARRAARAARAALLGVQIEALVRKTAVRLEADIKRRIIQLHIFDRGAYVGSWTIVHVPGVGYAVFSSIEYGPFQEYGTGKLGAMTYEQFSLDEELVTFDESWPGMMARPHVRPAAELQKKVLKRAGQMLVRRALR